MFLKETAYPFFREVAEFYEDYLIKDEGGIYQILPSQSPENLFEGTGNFPVSIGVSSAMDIELAMDAFSYAIQAAEILGVEKKIKVWTELKDGLPKLKIGSDGRLLEWDKEQRKEVEPEHRHLSHLYALYPSDIINEYETPEFYQAAKNSFEFRLAHGGSDGGFSRAWSACLAAKIGDRELFMERYRGIITDCVADSLLGLFPPRIVQVDVNMGAAAAVIESLVSVSGGKVRLLHALPEEWKEGSFCGIYVPGGHRISLSWKDGKVEHLEIVFGYEEEVVFIVNGSELTVKKDAPKVNLQF